MRREGGARRRDASPFAAPLFLPPLPGSWRTGVVSLRAAPAGAGQASSGRREPCHGDVAGRGAMRGPALPCSSLGTVSYGDGGGGWFAAPCGTGPCPSGAPPRPAAAPVCWLFPPPPPPRSCSLLRVCSAVYSRGAFGPGLPSFLLAAVGVCGQPAFCSRSAGALLCFPRRQPRAGAGSSAGGGSHFLLRRSEFGLSWWSGRLKPAGEPSRQARLAFTWPPCRVTGLRGRVRRGRRCLLSPSPPTAGFADPVSGVDP